ncbi:uncharacterized protein EV420DRAFT_1486506 [Desarmillaria tabescens]|uniref:Uncharacterized protein n=1 Tax=Armillaria tabescens TaxID=1929756 RepID=A0AA39JC18_ARMTA|nr:uncharacterized protein EV420DRAFT_1486506 [Desarmillaria tabescens]KAK0439046.1 hypothetical protein EV420DRAFT_1486506 [Desarmillaria tabescens]
MYEPLAMGSSMIQYERNPTEAPKLMAVYAGSDFIMGHEAGMSDVEVRASKQKMEVELYGEEKTAGLAGAGSEPCSDEANHVSFHRIVVQGCSFEAVNDQNRLSRYSCFGEGSHHRLETNPEGEFAFSVFEDRRVVREETVDLVAKQWC